MAITIVPFKTEYQANLLAIWEAAVLQTHDFLAFEDFLFYKQLINQIDFQSLVVYCLQDQQKIIGFIATQAQKIEMLFILPAYFGLGLGKKLVQYAIKHEGITEVDVNQQNRHALGFYQRMGFAIKQKKSYDDFNKPYPLYIMGLD